MLDLCYPVCYTVGMSDTKNTLPLELEIAEHTVDFTRKELASEARSIATNMDHLADKLEDSDLENPIVSSLGEIQSTGSHLNALCGSYNAAQEHLQAIRRLIAAQDQ